MSVDQIYTVFNTNNQGHLISKGKGILFCLGSGVKYIT